MEQAGGGNGAGRVCIVFRTASLLRQAGRKPDLAEEFVIGDAADHAMAADHHRRGTQDHHYRGAAGGHVPPLVTDRRSCDLMEARFLSCLERTRRAPGQLSGLGIQGDETFDIQIPEVLKPQQDITMVIRSKDGATRKVTLLSRIDTAIEVDYYRHGGILPFVLRELLAA